MTLYLSQVRLRRDAPLAALAPLLMPAAADARAGVSHRLIWSLFAGEPDAKREFLWREEASGRFLVLSEQLPADPHGLFDLDSKPFAPNLAAGEHLRFLLRANPTVARAGKRHDVVMDGLHAVPQAERAGRRSDIVRERGLAWLIAQGEAHGFAPDPERFAADGYETWQIPREGARPVRFSMVDLTGVVRIVDAERFTARLGHGFGRARAFGCGLMLIRRG